MNKKLFHQNVNSRFFQQLVNCFISGHICDNGYYSEKPYSTTQNIKDIQSTCAQIVISICFLNQHISNAWNI